MITTDEQERDIAFLIEKSKTEPVLKKLLIALGIIKHESTKQTPPRDA